MTKADRIKDSAYMVLGGIAYVFRPKSTILAYNLKNTRQTTEFHVVDDDEVSVCASSMSEANKWKSIAILERNKSSLIKGYREYEQADRDLATDAAVTIIYGLMYDYNIPAERIFEVMNPIKGFKEFLNDDDALICSLHDDSIYDIIDSWARFINAAC